MYKHRNPVYESVSAERHAEFEVKDTRVSDYLRKYGTGKLEDLPTSSAPEVRDDRTPDEMLDSEEYEPTMATEAIDILMEIDRNKDKFEAAVKELELTEKQKKDFEDAMAVLNDANSDVDRKREAYAIIQELKQSGKVVRARN